MAVADGVLPRPRGARAFVSRALAMTRTAEDELRISSNRLNVPMVVLLFLLGQFGGCVAPIAGGVWWLSRLAFRVDFLEAENAQRRKEIKMQDETIKDLRERLAEHGWGKILIAPSAREE